MRALDWTWLKVLVISVGYALVTTGICMVIGFPAAYFIGRSSEPLRNVLLTLVMIPFWTSFLIKIWISRSIRRRRGRRDYGGPLHANERATETRAQAIGRDQPKQPITRCWRRLTTLRGRYALRHTLTQVRAFRRRRGTPTRRS